MAIPSQAEYERNERDRFHRDLREIDRTPLSERKESCREFFEAMKGDPDLVAERVSWLLDGSYGKGSYDASREVARNTRMNRVAWLTQITGALEWRCPADMLIRAWKKLTSAEKDRLKNAVERALSRHLAEDSNGRDPRRRRTTRRDTSAYEERARRLVREGSYAEAIATLEEGAKRVRGTERERLLRAADDLRRRVGWPHPRRRSRARDPQVPSTPAGARAYKDRIDAMVRRHPGDSGGSSPSRSRRSRRG